MSQKRPNTCIEFTYDQIPPNFQSAFDDAIERRRSRAGSKSDFSYVTLQSGKYGYTGSYQVEKPRRVGGESLWRLGRVVDQRLGAFLTCVKILDEILGINTIHDAFSSRFFLEAVIKQGPFALIWLHNVSEHISKIPSTRGASYVAGTKRKSTAIDPLPSIIDLDDTNDESVTELDDTSDESSLEHPEMDDTGEESARVLSDDVLEGVSQPQNPSPLKNMCVMFDTEYSTVTANISALQHLCADKQKIVDTLRRVLDEQVVALKDGLEALEHATHVKTRMDNHYNEIADIVACLRTRESSYAYVIS